MNSKIKLVAAFLAVAVFMAATGAAAAWFGLRSRTGAAAAPAAASAAASTSAALASAPAEAPAPPPAPAPVVDTGPQKYVTLEKVVVMLRRDPADPVTHYLAMDVVFRAPEEHERTTRDHLPMLRSVAVKTLAALSVEKAGAMTIDEYAAEMNRAFTDTYAAERREKPFSEAMIGKLIIE